MVKSYVSRCVSCIFFHIVRLVPFHSVRSHLARCSCYSFNFAIFTCLVNVQIEYADSLNFTSTICSLFTIPENSYGRIKKKLPRHFLLKRFHCRAVAIFTWGNKKMWPKLDHSNKMISVVFRRRNKKWHEIVIKLE